MAASFECEVEKKDIETGLTLLTHQFVTVNGEDWGERKDLSLIITQVYDNVGVLLLKVAVKRTDKDNMPEIFGSFFSGFPGCCGIAVMHNGFTRRSSTIWVRGEMWNSPARNEISIKLKPGFWKAFTQWAIEFVKESDYTCLLAVDAEERALERSKVIAKELDFKTLFSFTNAKTTNECVVFGIDTGAENEDEYWEDDE